MTAFPRSRLAALTGVLALHLAMGWLLTQQRGLPLPNVLRTEVRLVPDRPRSPEPDPAQRAPTAPPPNVSPSMRAPVPEFQVIAPSLPSAPGVPAEISPPALPGPTPPAAQAPLNLKLPPPEARTRLPEIAEQLRHDPRANTPMRSEAQRMADALGAKGWTVTDLEDGGKMVRGPFGECAIIRPSMVDGIAGHPNAGLLPNRSFPCGGIEKGAKVAARPHERKR